MFQLPNGRPPINPRMLLLHQLLSQGGQPGVGGVPQGLLGNIMGQPPQFPHAPGGHFPGPPVQFPFQPRQPETPNADMIDPGGPLQDMIPHQGVSPDLNPFDSDPGLIHQAHVGDAHDIVRRLVQQITGARQARRSPPPSLRRGIGRPGGSNPRNDY